MSEHHFKNYPEQTVFTNSLDHVISGDARIEAELGETLKRCSAATVAAAWAFRKTGRPEFVSTILIGIIERYIESDLRWKLQSPRADLRLVEDLNVDSLTMMEIVLLAEEVLPISINNEDLRFLRTLGEVQQFAEVKVRELSAPEQFSDFVERRNSNEAQAAEQPSAFLTRSRHEVD